MKLEFLKSATLLITKNNKNLLVDPWLADGEYYGSWYHYPKFNLKNFLKKKIDFIFITHIHPDHFSRKTLNLFDKNIPVIIHKFAFPFIKFNLQNLGFKHIIEIDHGKEFKLSKDFFIKIYAADDCDPKLCQSFFKCDFLKDKLGSQQIDSLSVIYSKKHSIVNVNDCPFELSKKLITKKIKKDFKNIDVLLAGYSGAGPFPQCFLNQYSLKKIKDLAEQKKNQFLQQTLDFYNAIKPRYLMPFAGTYFLSSNLYSLNKYRGVPTPFQATQYFQKYLTKNLHKSKALLLDTNGWIDLDTNEIHLEQKKEKTKFDKKMKNYLKNKKLDYQKLPMPTNDAILNLINRAKVNFFNKIQQKNVNSNTKILIELRNNLIYCLDVKLKTGKYFNKNKLKNLNNFIKLKLDQRLLKLILTGPKFAHWDNADIGSHISYERKPDKFERNINYALNFLHC
jgi:UDP-MurNAc hydroxylase